ARLAALADHCGDGGSFDCEYRVRQADGRICWVHDRGRAERSASGAPTRLCGVLLPITHRKRREARLEHRASHDELTGLFNRGRLRQALEQALSESGGGQPGAYLALGVDRLAMIQDAYGPATAEAVIVGVGRRLERSLRAADVIGRAARDGYGVILGHCPADAVAGVAEAILAAFRDRPIDTPSGP